MRVIRRCIISINLSGHLPLRTGSADSTYPPTQVVYTCFVAAAEAAAEAAAATAAAAATSARAAAEAAAAHHCYGPEVIASAAAGPGVVTGCGPLPAYPPRCLVSMSQLPAPASVGPVGVEIYTHLLA